MTHTLTHMKAVCHQSVSSGNTVTVDHFTAGSSCPFALTEGRASKGKAKVKRGQGGSKVNS